MYILRTRIADVEDSVAAVVPLRSSLCVVIVAVLVSRSVVDGQTVRVPVEAPLEALLLGHHPQQRAAVAVGVHHLLPETR